MLEAIVTVFPAQGTFFTVTDRHDAGLRHALLDQKLFDGVCAAVAERQIVFFAPAIIAISFDNKLYTRMFLQPCRVALKPRYLVGPDLGLIVIEIDGLDILSEEIRKADVRSGPCVVSGRSRGGRTRTVTRAESEAVPPGPVAVAV